ncbi:MAG: XRE family transcriptional regulator [Myxococcales bacterium]|nr:XRE family transcriptional regulator [Myxococcales bacterium]
MGTEPKTPSDEARTSDIAHVVASNLKLRRAEQGLSLSELATKSGVSRAMIHQIERRQSAPTITVLWKLATALELPFSALLEQPTDSVVRVMKADRSWSLRSADGGFVSRALFPLDGPRNAELYELRLRPRAEEVAEAHAPGTRENLVVAQGQLTIKVEDRIYQLETSDAIVFGADVPHAYYNPSEDIETQVFLMMTYLER